MKSFKNLIISIFLLGVIFCLFNYSNEIIQYIMVNIVYNDEVLDKDANIYFKENNYDYAQLTTNFYPNNKQEIINVFYTGLSKGYDELIFYCPTTYESCIEDVNEIVTNENTLSYVNNFVSTYNTYNKIYVNINSFGRVNITINKIYDSKSIEKINNKIDEIYKELINDTMTDEEKIKTIHDYIINHTVYDQELANQIKSDTALNEINSSNTAYGPLFTGKAICGGYTDVMALFLDKMNIPNIKIASKNHIWNAVYINNKWLHLDLTWDDPVVINGPDTITYNYYLINTTDLINKNDGQHNFDENIFKELKD